MKLHKQNPNDQGDADAVVSEWHFDVGAMDSPGAFFHTTARGDEHLFPPNIPVFRIHGLPLSPVAALEFAIGELFPRAWEDATIGNAVEINRWRAMQRFRLTTYFEALKSAINPGTLTPLMLMKKWKPSSESMFLEP
ncbi:MAG: hypothetical protein M3T49_06260 [Candidatus Eremiobacteraeota bacterium]|nr:hypothetical protein [Candidatus Eremiobacteraeota bacterium]